MEDRCRSEFTDTLPTANFPHRADCFCFDASDRGASLSAVRLIFTVLLFVCSLASPLCGRDATVLRVGMELSYPPFEMADAKGQPEGVSVDLARALADSLSRKLEILNIPFDGLIPSLKTGKIDIILSSMSATPERAKAIDFSEPYLSTGLCLLAGKDSPVQTAADCDRPGRTVAVKQGTTGHLHARQFRQARVLVLDRETACVLEVVQGKADAFLYDQMSVLKHWQQNPNTTRALLEPFQKEQWAIGFRKGDDALRTQVNSFLKEFRGRGGFEDLGNRWLGPQKEAFRAAGIPFVF
jgi:polar amino acid transport system substrate-binding protein